MSLNIILGQIMGLCALVLLVISFQNNEKDKLLKYQTRANFFTALQYVFLGAVSGCLMCIVGSLRNIIFNKYKDRRPPVYILLFIIFLITFLSLFGYNGFISLLPTLGLLNYSYAVWTGDLRLIRIIDVLSCFLFIVYDAYVLAIIGILHNIIEMISALVAIYKYDIKGR